MNRTPNEKFVPLYEVAKRSMLATSLLFEQIKTELKTLEEDIFAGTDVRERSVPALLAAVSFIDFAHRFGSVVDALPLLNKKDPMMRKLREVLVPVEQARNYLQHMRGDLSSAAPVRYPILGSFCWTNGNGCCLIMFSQSTEVEAPSIAVDAHESLREGHIVWTARYVYRVSNAYVNLETVEDVIRQTNDWITSKVKFSDPSVALQTWGSTFACGFRMEFAESGPLALGAAKDPTQSG